MKAVDAYLYLSATQTAGHTGFERAWNLGAEAHILQLDIVSIVNIGDVDAHLIVLLGLDAFRESHGLGLHLSESIELGNGLHTLVGRLDGWECAVRIELEFLYSHATAEATTTWQFARVIEEVVVSLEVFVTTVVGERTCATFRHDGPLVSPRACRRRSLRICEMLRYTTCCIEEVVTCGWFALLGIGISHLWLLHDPRPFCIDIIVFLVSVSL